MRYVIDTLIVLLLIGAAGGVMLYLAHRDEQAVKVAEAQIALHRLHERMIYEKALNRDETGRHGFPRQIDPAWFRDDLPVNPLAEPDRAWIDLAPEGDMSAHPPDPVLSGPGQAGLWYNPNRGLFRARVPRRLSDDDTLLLYNEVNQTQLDELPIAMDDRRAPEEMPMPGDEPAEAEKPPHKQTLMDLSRTPKPPDKRQTLSDGSPAE